MLEAAAWGLLAGSFLVAGAVIGLVVRVPRQIVALVMAFGAGALTSALAFDLTAEAFEQGGTAITAAGLAAGAVAFVGGDMLLQRPEHRRLRRAGEAPAPDKQHAAGPAIVLGALLDGVPESVVLGSTLLGGAGVSASFMAAVIVANLPEGIAGTRHLADKGIRPSRIIALWAGVALASSLAAGIGFELMGGMSATPVAVAQAFAAGAILAMLADTMFPDAFADGGDAVGLATVFGFAAAFFLSRA